MNELSHISFPQRTFKGTIVPFWVRYLFTNWSHHILINRVSVVMINVTFNNISVISWRSVLMEEETAVPWENHRPVVSHWQALLRNVVSSTPRHERNSNSRYWKWLITYVVLNPTIILSRQRRPLLFGDTYFKSMITFTCKD